MDYVRVDWSNGNYEYLKNDILCEDGEYRSGFLLHNHRQYKRIRRMKELPEGKKLTIYNRHNKIKKDWEKQDI